jgi:hypothetical protein
MLKHSIRKPLARSQIQAEPKRIRAGVVAAFKADLVRRRKLLVLLKSFDREIIARAVACFNSPAGAAFWLTHPQYGLNGRIPVEMQIGPRTKAEFLTLLARIHYGVLA